MNRAVFLDRDGTINNDTNYINTPDRLELLDNVIGGLKKLQTAGFLLIIVTNQSGVARGYFTESMLKKINNRLLNILQKHNIKITAVYYSPYHKDAKFEKYKKGAKFRKPAPGMILSAAEKFNIDISASYMIGDSVSDIGAGYNAGVKASILINRKKYIIEKMEYKPDKAVKNLNQAADWILKQDSINKIFYSYDEVKKYTDKLRKQNKKIVFTNGVFDILHIGHLRYLKKAKSYGNNLIIGVNSDDSVKKNKGDKRPIISQFARAELISSLKFVDAVVVFNEKDPRKIVSYVKPNIHIKGGDYSMSQIIEKKEVEKNKGKVVLVDLIKNYSTSKIIKKILEVYRK